MEKTPYKCLFQVSLNQQTAFWALGFTLNNRKIFLLPTRNIRRALKKSPELFHYQHQDSSDWGRRAVYHMRKRIPRAPLVLLWNLEEAALCTKHWALGARNPSQFTTGTAESNRPWSCLFLCIYSTSQLRLKTEHANKCIWGIREYSFLSHQNCSDLHLHLLFCLLKVLVYI